MKLPFESDRIERHQHCISFRPEVVSKIDMYSLKILERGGLVLIIEKNFRIYHVDSMGIVKANNLVNVSHSYS